MEGSVSLKVLAGYLQSSCPLKCVFRVVSAFMESFCCRVSPRYFQTGAPRKVWLKSSHQGQINYLWGPELAIKQDWDLQLAFIFYYCVNCQWVFSNLPAELPVCPSVAMRISRSSDHLQYYHLTTALLLPIFPIPRFTKAENVLC